MRSDVTGSGATIRYCLVGDGIVVQQWDLKGGWNERKIIGYDN